MSGDRGYVERASAHGAIAAVWSHSARVDGESWVAADGCFDLIVETSARGRASAFVYTPAPEALRTSSAAGARVIGVRLRPGHGAALIARQDLLAEAVAVVSRGGSLEALVASVVDDHPRPPAIVGDFVEQARASRGAMRLGAPSSPARERALQRACRTWLGMSAKSFLRIERAWAAREVIRSGAPLAHTAAALGFADQAHLSRELRTLLAATPRSLRGVGNLQDPAVPAR